MGTMKHMLIGGLAYLLLLSFAFPAHAANRRDRFIEVDAAELRDSPHRYWSRGVIFQDTLTRHPAGRTLRLDDRRFIEIRIDTIGEAYVDRDRADQFEELELDREYLFTGMVLSRTGRDFLMRRRRTEYYVTITDATPLAADTEETLTRMLRPDYDEVVPDVMKALLNRIQRQLLVYTEEHDMEIADLFDRDRPEHFDRTVELVRSTIRAFEREEETTSFIILSDLIYTLLAMEYRQPPVIEEEPVEEEPVDEELEPPGPEPVTDEEVREEPVEEAIETPEPEVMTEEEPADPPPRGFWRRLFSRSEQEPDAQDDADPPEASETDLIAPIEEFEEPDAPPPEVPIDEPPESEYAPPVTDIEHDDDREVEEPSAPEAMPEEAEEAPEPVSPNHLRPMQRR